MKKRVVLIFSLFLVGVLNAQIISLGQNPNSINWQVLKTPAGNIIYPFEIDSSAQRIAKMINFQKDNLTKTVGDKSEKISIVLQNRTVIPNGYVGLAPLRSEFYTTPPENMQNLGSINWLDLLSIHEYRHVQQIANTKYGLSKFSYFFGGDFLWNTAINLSIPNWYFEGDAVWTETSYTDSGRGRIPYFTAQQRALAFSDVNYSYQKSRNGSFKDYVPNHYPLGYMMLSYLRNEKGSEIMNPVIKDASAYKGIIYPFSRALKKHTGYSSSSLYKSSWNSSKKLWGDQLANVKTEPTTAVTSRKNRTVTNYYFPQYKDNEAIIAIKNSYKTTDHIVEITNNGEKKLFSIGVNLEKYYNYTDGYYVWTEIRQNPRRNNENYSDILLLNSVSGKKTKITCKGKYFSPILTKNGNQILSIHFSPDQKTTLKQINVLTKKKSTVTTFSAGELITRLSFSNDEKEVVYVVKKNSLLAIWKYNLKTKTKTQLTNWTSHIIDTPRVHANQVYFSGSYSGIDNIYRTPLDGSKIIEQVTFVKIGAYQPSISKDGNTLLFTEHTKMGRIISKIDLPINKPDSSVFIEPVEPKNMDWLDKTSDKSEINNFVTQIPSPNYKSEKYKGFFRDLKLHSWNIIASNVSPSVGLFLDNYLNDFSVAFDLGYNFNEKGVNSHASIIYGKWYPQVGLNIGQSIRTTESISITNKLTKHSFNEQYINVDTSVPLQWIMGDFYTSLVPNIGFNHHRINNVLKIDNQDFNTIEGRVHVSVTKRMAPQNLASRLGMSTNIGYINNVDKSEFGKINITSKVYLPGIGKNDSFRLSGGYQKEPLNNVFQIIDDFQYPRGFNTPINDEFKSCSAEYTVTLMYPDIGLVGITYFKRIKANLFYDYGQAKIDLFNKTIDYQSTGVELILDNTLLNVLPISFGVRGSYLLSKDPANLDKKHSLSFFIFHRL